MQILPLAETDARLIRLAPSRDDRGAFVRTWCAAAFAEAGLAFAPVQANASLTRGRGSLRGMHVQRAPSREAKLVRCLRGRVHDVVVDLRPGSPARLRPAAIVLDAAEPVSLFVPAGFAHGFQVLSDEAEVAYLMGDSYAPDLADGFRYDDPAAGIDWPLPAATISARDLAFAPLAGRDLA